MPALRSQKNRPLQIQEPARSKRRGNEDDHEVWLAKKLKGKYPPLTNHSKSAVDAQRGKVYFYGGYRPEDKREIPTSDFRVFDINTMEFVDLTASLSQITPPDADLDVKPEPKRKRLPRLSQPGMALIDVQNRSFIFLFGGHDVDGPAGGPSSALIAIDLSHKQWYYVPFEDNSQQAGPAARIDPILIGVIEKLYVFDGLTGFGENWAYHRSFSVAEFRLGKKSKWVVVDAPYPQNVPAGHFFGKGLAVYEGDMILLLPGRAQEKARIQFRRDNIFYFIPRNKTFLKATIKGALPRDVVWFYVNPLDRSVSSPSGPLPYGTPEAVPSVMLCTWLPYGKNDLSPELWKFTIFPINTFVRLGVAEKLYKLEVNFHRFAMIGSRAFLFGQGDWPEKKAMCNTYTEIPVRELLIKEESRD